VSRIFEITERVRAYAPKADLDLINRAYVFAAHAHGDQVRRSGEPYVTHPLAVANILASLKLDEASIVTALLHDTVEDTHVTLADVEHRFGAEIARLVDGVTKIGQIRFRSSEHKQAENFRKMILATAQDLRVLLIKLADRLHNMRTLNFLPENKRIGIAQETMQLYAPLAHRLGIHWIKQEMEDLSFAQLDPGAYHDLIAQMKDHIEGLQQVQRRLETIIQQALDRKGVKAQVQGRMKHLYSVHEKMQRKHIDFNDIYDLVAFRIIVDDTAACYQTLGIIHSLYRPVPGRFKDYIALPKPNGYQSLHTSVIGPENFRIEVQIRTASMHRFAEDGIAAHWRYKGEGQDGGDDDRSFQWLKQLTELIQEVENPGEFLENVRLDLFVQEVYVFSRDGDIFALPRGARPLDFAYAVHTDVGNHCIGVRINGEIADFQTRLHNGDQIEIMTSPDQTPSRQWLQYVRTPRARQSIRQWFRRQERNTSIRMGEQIIREAMGKAEIKPEVLERLECADVDGLKEGLGRGDIPLDQFLAAVEREQAGPLNIKGMAKAMMVPAECCHPIPGDPVLGQFRAGKGLMLHHRKCPEVKHADSSWLDVSWAPQKGQSYPTGIEVITRNERGMLARVSSCMAETNANIEDLKIHQRGGSVTELLFLIDVEDRIHLASVLRAIKALDGVVRVGRKNRVGLEKPHMTRSFGEAFRDMVFRRKKVKVEAKGETEGERS